jgi:uncharacterized protein YkwD
MKTRRPRGVLLRFSLVAFVCTLLFSARVGAQKGPHADTLSPLEQEMYQEINLVRTRPQEYANYLEQLRPFFKGNLFQPPGKAALTTAEGVAALDEAIRALRQAQPLKPYELSRGMSLGANLLVKDQGAKGLTGHRDTAGNYCEARLGRFGTWQGTVGENLSYGRDNARLRILTLLIDDGVANRGHRTRLLSPDYKVVGVSCGDHAQLGLMCVIDFAGGFADKQQPQTGGGAYRF